MKKLLSVILTLVLLLSVVPLGAVGAQEFCEHLNKSSKWDSENHWTECNDCHEKFNLNSHNLKYTNDGETHSVTCKNCEYSESGLRHDLSDVYCYLCDAQFNTFVEGCYKYAVSNNMAILLDTVGILDSDLSIPSTLGGTSVKSIGEYVFYNCDNIINVTIPDSVETIGDSAFAYCDNLTSITIPDSVEIIGDSAFYDCDNLADVWYTGSETDREKIEIDSWNSDFISATWHYNICENHSFSTDACGEKCSNCDFVKEHKMVTKYNDNNHWTVCENPNCTERTAYIPHEKESRIVDYFNHGNACYCGYATNLEYHTYLYDNEDYYDYVCDCGLRREAFYYNGFRYRIENGGIEIVGYQNVIEGNLEIPNTIGSLPVTSIGYNVFYNCDNLTSVTLGNSVKSIGDSAFAYCDKLTSITIPDNVESIGDSAFYNCDNLTSITLGNSVKSIGDYAFAYCDNITSVTIGNGVTSIGEYAFENCYNLKSVTIGSGVESIGDNAFCSCDNLTSITIPDSVEIIGNYAFEECYNLNNVTIGNGVKSIGDSAFRYCENLTNVTLGNSVKSIGDYAFGNCYNLTSITIPNSVNSIGNGAFYECYDLERVNIPQNITTIGEKTFALTSINNIIIPSGVTYIGESAFDECWGLADTWYEGGVTDKNNIKIERGNECLEYATWHYNSTGPCTQHTWKNATCTEPMTCTVCGKTEGIEKGHDYTQKVVTPATCKNTGIMNYKCTVCGDSFNRTISKTTKHNYKTYIITNATYAKAGSVVVKCTVCGTVKTRSTIAKLVPKTTKISKLTAKKKSLVVKLKKQKSVTGYEIQYSLKKNFKGAKTVTLKKNSTISKTIKKLKSKKTYYVRVRTYKTYKGKKYYSAWSKTVKKKTK